jgi:hypothetical protein
MISIGSRPIPRRISPLPSRYLINTYYHGDHTGGDAAFHKVGHPLHNCLCGKGQSSERGGDDGPTPVVEPKRGAALKATVDRHRHNRRQVFHQHARRVRRVRDDDGLPITRLSD